MLLKKEILIRVKEISDYMIKTKQTIREVAEVFGISKSTVHQDIQVRLKEIDLDAYNQISDIFKEHLEIRHIIGGESTKQKYQKLRETSGG